MLGPFAVAVIALLSASFIDMMYLGRLTSESVANLGVIATAAITVAGPLTFLGNSANIGLGAGTMSAISRAIGEDDRAKAKRRAAAAIIFGLLVMSVLVTLMVITIPFILPFLDDDQQVLDYAYTYLMISLPGLIIISVASMCNNILRADGEAILPSSIMIMGAVINIILDPFLIFGWGPFPRMEIQGAAIATLTGNICAAMYGFWVVFYKRKAMDFGQITVQSFKRAAKIIGSVGIPAAMTNIVVPIGTVVAVAIVGNKLTTTELSAFGYSRQAELISVGLIYALSACIGAVTGQNGGAGHTDRVKETFKECYKICFIWCSLMAVVLAVFAGPITGFMTPDDSVAAALRDYFYIVPVTVFAYGFVFLSAAGLNALGRPQYGLVYTIIRSLVLYTLFIYIGVTVRGGLIGAFWGIAAANIIAGFIAFSWTLKRAPMTAVKS